MFWDCHKQKRLRGGWMSQTELRRLLLKKRVEKLALESCDIGSPSSAELSRCEMNSLRQSRFSEDEFQLKFSDHEFRRIASIRGARHANAAKLTLKHGA